jgi:predicted HicB family RNase H-like nuclease
MALSHHIMSIQNQPHPKPVQVRMKAETHQWIHEQARAQERSANWIINRVLDEARMRQSTTPKGNP